MLEHSKNDDIRAIVGRFPEPAFLHKPQSLVELVSLSIGLIHPNHEAVAPQLLEGIPEARLYKGSIGPSALVSGGNGALNGSAVEVKVRHHHQRFPPPEQR